jgi:hypothetical protein
MNELAPCSGREGDIGRELVMCCVYVGRVAEVVSVPRKGWGCLGGIVDTRCRRKGAHGGQKEGNGSINHGSTTALEAIQPRGLHMVSYGD